MWCIHQAKPPRHLTNQASRLRELPAQVSSWKQEGNIMISVALTAVACTPLQSMLAQIACTLISTWVEGARWCPSSGEETQFSLPSTSKIGSACCGCDLESICLWPPQFAISRGGEGHSPNKRVQLYDHTCNELSAQQSDLAKRRLQGALVKESDLAQGLVGVAEKLQLPPKPLVLARQQGRLAARVLVHARLVHDLLGPLSESQRGLRLPRAPHARAHVCDDHRLRVAPKRVLHVGQRNLCLPFVLFYERCSPFVWVRPSLDAAHACMCLSMTPWSRAQGLTVAAQRIDMPKQPLWHRHARSADK